VKREAFKTLLPRYSLTAAAGYFGNGEAVEPEGWIEADGVGRLDQQMVVCRAVGRSMEPTIHDGDYLVFRARPAGTQQGNIVLCGERDRLVTYPLARGWWRCPPCRVAVTGPSQAALVLASAASQLVSRPTG
jgi:hypothetical protein